MPSDQPTPDQVFPAERFGELLHQYDAAVAAKDFKEAETAVDAIFAAASDLCDDHPTPEYMLSVFALGRMENADWLGAELAYRRILSLPNLDASTEYKARADLTGLFGLLNRHAGALAHARRATEAARRDGCSILLAMACGSEARVLITCGRAGEADAVIAEGIAAICGDEMGNQMLARLLILRAECEIESDCLSAADSDLKTAFGLIEPLIPMTSAAGVQSDRGRFWAATAKLRMKRNDYDGAVQSWQEAVTISKSVAALPQVETPYGLFMVAYMLKGLADALVACNRSADANAALSERKSILRRAGLPDAGVA